MRESRRTFLRNQCAWTLGFLGLRAAAQSSGSEPGLGELVPDRYGILELPRGFNYDAFSYTGTVMDDGFRVPDAHDSMGVFPGRGGTTIVVRNHESGVGPPDAGPYRGDSRLFSRLDRRMIYDPGRGIQPALGGTTTFVYDTRERRLVRQFLSLTGTVRNCSGGHTPWGTWITCEENVQRQTGNYEVDHGYCFEVPATDQPGLAEPAPLIAMGRFNHEAVAVDARTSIVYLTEDRGDGLLYRYLPAKRGSVIHGGELQALVVRDRPGLDTRNYTASVLRVGSVLDVSWVGIEDVTSPNDDLRRQGFTKGAALFSRGEGMWPTPEAIFFACTDGGPARRGQIFRYVPSPYEGRPLENRFPGRLELFFESNDANRYDSGDNITVAPWGDLFVCEDGAGGDSVVAVTPEGQVYPFLRNIANESEFTGGVFSPDGTTFFVNIQSPGLTFAIWGPWERRSGADAA